MNGKSKKCVIGISGMHCATCANTIEKKLKKTKGILSARVNFATEKCIAEYDPSKTSEEKIADAINSTGYKAAPIREGMDHSEHLKALKEEEMKILKRKLVSGAILSAVIFLGSFPEWFSFSINPYILLALATAVQFWVGYDFYRGAWI